MVQRRGCISGASCLGSNDLSLFRSHLFENSEFNIFLHYVSSRKTRIQFREINFPCVIRATSGVKFPFAEITTLNAIKKELNLG